VQTVDNQKKLAGCRADTGFVEVGN
jgi:hypothetical protein